MERSRTGPAGSFQRNPPPRERVSSLKNRLLAIEMAERPNVMAALSRVNLNSSKTKVFWNKVSNAGCIALKEFIQ